MHFSYEEYRSNDRKKIFYFCLIVGSVFFVYACVQQNTVTFKSNSLNVWNRSEQRIKRPLHIDLDHSFCGRCPADKHYSNAWQLIDLVDYTSSNHRFLVNIGAACARGGIYDPTYPILTAVNSTFGALLIDPQTDPSFFNAYPSRSNIHISHDYIWSESIVKDIFQKYNVSKDFSILKLDIDSYECTILDSILTAGYRPEIVHTEFNPIFPPPIIFKPIYNSTMKSDWKPSLWSNNGPFYGCSLSALSKVLKSFNYILFEVDFWDAIYIHEKIALSSRVQVPLNDDVAYKHGFIGHSCFPYCRDNPKLYNHVIDSSIGALLNQSNFTAHMTDIINNFAPISNTNNIKHPYIVSV